MQLKGVNITAPPYLTRFFRKKTRRHLSKNYKWSIGPSGTEDFAMLNVWFSWQKNVYR